MMDGEVQLPVSCRRFVRKVSFMTVNIEKGKLIYASNYRCLSYRT